MENKSVLNPLAISDIVTTGPDKPKNGGVREMGESLVSMNPKDEGSKGFSSNLKTGDVAPDFNQSTMTSRFRMKKMKFNNMGESNSEVKLTSCTRCRRLKKKCDKSQPSCFNCDKAGEVCTYLPRKKRKKAGSEDTADETEEGEAQKPGYVANPVVANRVNGNDNYHLPQATTNYGSYFNSNSAPNNANSFVNMNTMRMPGYAQETMPQYSQMPPAIPKQKTAMPANSINALVPNFASYPRKVSDILVSVVGIHTKTDVTIIPPILNQDLIMQFVQAYFKHNHRAYPVVNKAEFMEKLESSGYSNLYQFDDQFEVNMVIAIGCTSLERAGIISREKRISEYFASRALNSVTNDLSRNDYTNIKYLLLLGLYSYFDPSEFSSWEITGKLTRLAISLGLNKKLSDNAKGTISPKEEEMRYRSFWSIYTMDRIVSVSLGRPLSIRDEDVNVPMPKVLDGDDEVEIEINKLIIELRKLEGRILSMVHSVNASANVDDKESQQEHCENVLSKLKAEIETWYSNARGQQNVSISHSKSSFSFHGSVPWYSARYYHLLMLLYRPSYLVPSPSPEILELLGKCCLQTLSCTYNLYISNLLPLNWITLYRFLTVCTTILYCLCKWSIDLIDSKTEICYCIEILECFGNDWSVAKKCAEVFRTIDSKMLEISLTSQRSVPFMDELLNELLGASSSYHEILVNHSIDISLDNPFLLN